MAVREIKRVDIYITPLCMSALELAVVSDGNENKPDITLIPNDSLTIAGDGGTEFVLHHSAKPVPAKPTWWERFLDWIGF